MTQNSKFNYLEDAFISTNLAMSVAKQTTFLKAVLKIFVINITKKDISLPFVLTKYLKEKATRLATKVIIPIDNVLTTIAEDVII